MRLHIGCGTKLLPTPWINIDREGRVDVTLDIRKGLPYPDQSIEWIYCSHMIEHFEYDDIVPVLLREWHRVLIPGGKLTLATTEIRGIYSRYHRGVGEGAWISPLFGATGGLDVNPLMAHKCVFDTDMLTHFLKEAGFVDVRPWEPEEYPEIRAMRDFAVSARDVSLLLEGIA